MTNLESLLKAVYEFSITSIEHVRMLKHLAVASKQYELASELRGFEEDLIAAQPKEEIPEHVRSSDSVVRQELRYNLVIELIRAGKENFLSLAKEASDFVLNGMENKPVPIASVGEDLSIIFPTGIAETLKEVEQRLTNPGPAPSSDPSQDEVQGGGESAEPQMTLWEMCEAIIQKSGKDRVDSGEKALHRFSSDRFEIRLDGGRGWIGIVPSSTDESLPGVRKDLMRFPPFKK